MQFSTQDDLKCITVTLSTGSKTTATALKNIYNSFQCKHQLKLNNSYVMDQTSSPIHLCVFSKTPRNVSQIQQKSSNL